MADPGETISNPVTGEVITFVLTSAQTAGELLALDDRWTRRGERTPPHVHPGMEERFEVVAGTARLRVDGLEHTLAPGDVLTVPRGTPHVGWNPTEEEVRMRLEFRPALRWEEFVSRLFELARAGRTDARGVPEPAVLAELLREFSREIAPAPAASRARDR